MIESHPAEFIMVSEYIPDIVHAFPLGDVLLAESLRIENGQVLCPTTPGIGIEITPEIEAKFPFDPKAVYSCKLLNRGAPSDESWKD